MKTKELVKLWEANWRPGIAELSRELPRVAFRRVLNLREELEGWGKHKNNIYRQRSRGYGDYLYFQDRDMFEDNYRRWLETIQDERELHNGKRAV